MAAAPPPAMTDGSPASTRSPPPPSRLVAPPAPDPSSAMAAASPRSRGAEHGDDRTNIVTSDSGKVAEKLVDGGDSQRSKNLRMRTQKEVAGNCGNEQDRASALSAGGNEDDTLAFIIQVKEEVERCLEAGMSKKQMFRELREKGSPPAATFAVYKELRHQNNDFFKEYYVKMDLKKQAGRLKLLLHQYRTVRAGGPDTRPRGTATQQTTTAAPDDVELSKNGAVLVGLHGNRQPPPGRNYHRR